MWFQRTGSMPHLSDASPKNCSLLSLQYRCKYIVSISSLLMQFAALQQPYRTARPESCPSPPLAAGFKLTAAGFKLTAAAAAIRGAVHPSLPPVPATATYRGRRRGAAQTHPSPPPAPAVAGFKLVWLLQAAVSAAAADHRTSSYESSLPSPSEAPAAATARGPGGNFAVARERRLVAGANFPVQIFRMDYMLLFAPTILGASRFSILALGINEIGYKLALRT